MHEFGVWCTSLRGGAQVPSILHSIQPGCTIFGGIARLWSALHNLSDLRTIFVWNRTTFSQRRTTSRA